MNWGRKYLVYFSTVKTQLVSFDQSNNISPIDVRMVGYILKEKSWGSLTLLNWIRALTLAVLLKLPSRKLEPWFVQWGLVLSPEIALYLCKSTAHPCMEHCCHVWAGGPSCYLEIWDKLQKWICRNVGHLLSVLNPWLIFFSTGITLVDVHLNCL